MSSSAPPLSPSSFISLPSKPFAKLAYVFIPSGPPVPNPGDTLIVFLNGLGLPMKSWAGAISLLRQPSGSQPSFSMLAYDRFGQGETTERDPLDVQAPDPRHAHDIMSAVHDLHELIPEVLSSQARASRSESSSSPSSLEMKTLASVSNSPYYPLHVPKLLLVGNSIGCVLARLYAAEYPGTVAAMLLLDSNMTNTDFVSIFPNPDSPSFDASTLPTGIEPADLHTMRARMASMFHPSVGSAEGLSRRNLQGLLPHANAPRLVGWWLPGEAVRNGDAVPRKGPFVTVVGHGWDAFAQEGLKVMGTPRAINLEYMNPFWWEYNQGLCQITDSDRARGPIEAIGAGHFIQKDRPDLVAEECLRLATLVASL